MKTRSKPPKDASVLEPTESRLPPRDADPPKLFVLPKSLGKAATIVTLAHPRTLAPTRFFFCPDTGIYELKRFAAPRSACRSILLSPLGHREVCVEESNGSLSRPDSDGEGMSVADGYILEKAELFIATPFDLLFLVLPALSPKPTTSKSEPEKTYFLSADDLFDRLFEDSRHFQYVLRNETVRKSIESRVAEACDSVEAGDETMYRLSQEKLLQEVIRKARQVVSAGLPPSLEERFVTRALQRPLTTEIGQEQLARNSVTTGEEAEAEKETHSLEAAESQTSSSTMSSTLASNTAASTPLTVPSPPAHSSDIPHLLRLRTAIQFMLSSYFPPHLAASLLDALSAPSSPIGFAPLDEHLADLAKVRAEAAAARALSNFSRKRSAEDDHEREEKRRRKAEQEEQEKARKKAEPRGLKELKKVDTSGMKKMSDFFKKKT